MSEPDAANGEWYISRPHAQRALGYLGAELVTKGHMSETFEFPILLDIWADALTATMRIDDHLPSPIPAPS